MIRTFLVLALPVAGCMSGCMTGDVASSGTASTVSVSLCDQSIVLPITAPDGGALTAQCVLVSDGVPNACGESPAPGYARCCCGLEGGPHESFQLSLDGGTGP